jgi:DNA mismatch repair protein MLH1
MLTVSPKRGRGRNVRWMKMSEMTKTVHLSSPLVSDSMIAFVEPCLRHIFHLVASEAQKKIYSQHKVRTSLQERTLDSMFPISNPSRINSSGDKSTEEPLPTLSKSREIKESECNLSSVQNLRNAIPNGKHFRKIPYSVSDDCLQFWILELTEILEKHTFVGIVEVDRGLSLLQHSTNLYLVNHGALA